MNRRWTSVSAAVALLAGLGGLSHAARANDPTAPQLGGVALSARGNGADLAYDLPGALPIGPLVDVAAPYAQASLADGPRGDGQAAIAYPGPVVLGLNALLAEGGAPPSARLPAYPFFIEARTGATTSVRDDHTVPGSVVAAKVDGASVQVEADGTATSTTGTIDMGASHTAATTAVVGKLATSHAHVEVGRAILLGGLLSFDGITTDLNATSDGVKGKSGGSSTVAGARLLGLPVTVDANGVHLVPPADGAGKATGPLSAVVGALSPTVGPGSSAVAAVLAAAGGDANTVLAALGLAVHFAPATEQLDGASAYRSSSGLRIDITQHLGATPVGALLDKLPALPNLPGAPLQLSDVLQILKSKQVGSITLGSAEVQASASPAYVPAGGVAAPSANPATGVPGSSPESGPADLGTPGSLSAAGPAGGRPVLPILGAASTHALPLGPLTSWWLVVLALLGAALASIGTRKLPDWALARRDDARCPLTEGTRR